MLAEASDGYAATPTRTSSSLERADTAAREHPLVKEALAKVVDEPMIHEMEDLDLVGDGLTMKVNMKATHPKRKL